MLITRVNGQVIRPEPGSRSTCSQCRSELLSKCGEIKIWHWAHLADDCDTWAEHETEWHSWWKSRFPEHEQEVTVGCHRADVRTDTGWVFEFQHSSISAQEILEREAFYGKMAWVLDAGEFASHFLVRHKGDHATFRWKWPRPSWYAAQRPVLMDFGNGSMFRIKKIYGKTPCGGWGRTLARDEFVKWATSNWRRDGLATARTA